MRCIQSILISSSLFALLGGAADARAQSELPPNRSVIFQTHADPQDTESPVVTSVEIRLTAVSRNGNSVAWSAAWIEITLFDEYSEVFDIWFEENPVLETGNGLWQVVHANPLMPTAAEFALPPEMSGIAASTLLEDDALVYYLKGESVGAPNSPYAITSIMDYSFRMTEDPEPLDEGDGNPVETDDPETNE